MTAKKMVSTEPAWTITRKKAYTRKPTNTVTLCVVNSEKPEVRFVFNGENAVLFGEKYIVFSDITNPERIYFKIASNGYKTTRYKTSAQVHFRVDEETKKAFEEIWAGSDYEVKQERSYYYVESKIEALFDEPETVMNALKVEKVPTKKAGIAPPAGAEWLAPMPESGISNKKVLAVLARIKEKGYVALSDLKVLNMNDRDYYNAVTDLVKIYGYAIVDIPCIDATGKRYFVKALYNGTGEWE